MQDFKVFSKQNILLISLTTIFLLALSFVIQYNYQLENKAKYFNSKIEDEVKKSINKKIFEIEASIKSLASFYQSSDEFTTSTFGYVSNDLIDHYPVIEKIIYTSLIYEEDKNEFYKDMYNNGFFNFKINTNSKKDYYLAVTNIAPDSYKYGKYLGFDILNNEKLEPFFKELGISTLIGYSHEKILTGNKNLLHLAIATYYGTDIPDIENREEQISGYFIVSINLDFMLKTLKNEFNIYTFSLEKLKTLNLEKTASSINEVKLDLPTSDLETIYVYYPLYFDDLNIFKIFINTLLLLLFVSISTYIVYMYKKHLLYKEFSQEQLHKSEKMASLGQMIGNISHQWRQPLSAISMTASSIQVKHELGILDSKDLEKNMKDIVKKTEYLSETINTFRDFIKEEKDLQEVYLEDRIKQSMSIVGLVLADNNIQVIDTIDYEDKLKMKMVVGELDQVIINIVNNAKDVLVDRRVEEASIEISLIKDNSKVTITIEDNAGGIPDNVMPKIFDPYFTTKHKTQGTGLGLHMSYRIISESLKGRLYAKNTNKGAKFYIELPLNQSKP